MSFLSSMNISASGMTAQRLRLDVASENIANINTTRTESGGPYQKKSVVFQSVENFKQSLQNAAAGTGTTSEITATPGGVIATEVVSDDREFQSVYDPDNPDADANGYVKMPNVDLTKETVDSMSATRSYEADITAFNAIKLMAQKAIEIGQ